MKIAVLTYNFNNNYGGILQAYAMMTFLKKLKHEPELLFVQTIDLSKKKRIKYLVKKYFLCYIFDKWPDIRYKDKIEKNTNYFIDKYITPKTKPIYKKEHFYEIVKNNYDAYLVGSDQVWRARVYRYIDYAFFGFVTSDKPTFLSYATSFGIDTWNYTKEETVKYSEQLKRFSGISVREDSGVELCKEHFNVEAKHVLDPTMLLEVDDYIKLFIQENEQKLDGELLYYILDDNEEKKALVEIVSNLLNIKPFKVNVKATDLKYSIHDKVYPSVTSWLKGFYDAKYLVTDSFHGCVFAILFNKPFIVYGNEQRGMARFKSLLNMFDLQDRLVYSINEISDCKIQNEIDWNKVNIKINEYRNISKNYLIETLKVKV